MSDYRRIAAWWYAAGWEDARGQLSDDVCPDYVGMFATYAQNQDDAYRAGERVSLPGVADQWIAWVAGEKVVRWLTVTLPAEPRVSCSSELGTGYYDLSRAVETIAEVTQLDPAAIRETLEAGDIIEVCGVEWGCIR